MNDYQKRVTEIQRRFDKDRRRKFLLETIEIIGWIALVAGFLIYSLVRKYL